MADFNITYRKTFEEESGYVADLGDGGGETYCGITYNYNKDWEGWKYIKELKKQRGGKLPHRFIAKTGPLPGLVISFYKNKFWNRLKGDSMINQDVADLTFDFSFQSGGGLIAINNALQKLAGGRLQASKTAFTDSVINFLNNNQVPAYRQILATRKAYVKQNVQPRYLESVLDRISRFPSDTVHISIQQRRMEQPKQPQIVQPKPVSNTSWFEFLNPFKWF
jgi:lysozyme family protein